MKPVAVCFDPDLAAALAGAGWAVVLCRPVVDGRGVQSVVGGRIAYFLVEEGDDGRRVEYEAGVMAQELFGADALIVRDRGHAEALITRRPGPPPEE